MRISLAALAFLLTLAILHSEAIEERADNLHVCCFTSVKRTIPLSFVRNYQRTSDQCSQPGVIFQTRNGRSICADPGQAWVQKYIKYLDQRSKGAGSSETFTVEGKREEATEPAPSPASCLTPDAPCPGRVLAK